MSSSISISKALFSSVYGHSHLLSILPFLVTLKFELFWWFSFWVFVVSVRHSWCSCVDFVTYSFAEIVYQFCRSFRICTNETMLSGNRSKLISPFPFWLVFTTFSCLIVLPLILFTLKVKKLGLQKLITLPKLKKTLTTFTLYQESGQQNQVASCLVEIERGPFLAKHSDLFFMSLSSFSRDYHIPNH
jgi:hypothetical protein